MANLILGVTITTKYCGATDSRDSRIMAVYKRDRDETLRCYRPYEDAMSAEENHQATAEKLLSEKWGHKHNLAIIARGSDNDYYHWIAASKNLYSVSINP
jgi:hypothetical protein